MPLSDEERQWAESKIASGVPKEQVFQFLSQKRGESTTIDPRSPMVSPRIDQKSPFAQPVQPNSNPPPLAGVFTPNERDRRLMGIQGALMGIGGLTGGIAGRAVLGPALTRPVGAAFGEAAGTYAGGRIGGMSNDEAKMAALLAGGTGLAVEGGGNLAARVAGATTSMPGSIIHETMNMSPVDQIKAMTKPVGQPEMMQGRNVLDQINKAQNTLSPGRLSKQAIVDQADKMGLKISTGPLKNEIVNGYMNANQAVGRSNQQASAHLESLDNGISRKFPRGTMTPKEADAQLQAFQRDADAAAAKNNPFLAQTYRSLKNTLRDSFHSQVEAALPGSGIKETTASARRYMDAVDNLSEFVSKKTPETFIRSLFGGEEQSQSAVDALRVFEKEIGTGGAIEKEAHDLAMKRAWTKEEVGRGFSLWRFMEKALAKPATKALIVSHRPLGQAASIAATTAFENSMKKDNQ